jgi:hypothetical protein
MRRREGPPLSVVNSLLSRPTHCIELHVRQFSPIRRKVAHPARNPVALEHDGWVAGVAPVLIDIPAHSVDGELSLIRMRGPRPGDAAKVVGQAFAGFAECNLFASIRPLRPPPRRYDHGRMSGALLAPALPKTLQPLRGWRRANSPTNVGNVGQCGMYIRRWPNDDIARRGRRPAYANVGAVLSVASKRVRR